MRGLNEDNNLLTAKVEKKRLVKVFLRILACITVHVVIYFCYLLHFSQLQASSETIEEYISRQKQLLREATAKYQVTCTCSYMY